ncbi:hypothetical protein BBJ28_00004283 [Nothophytophthora sp. Chile5]|nr:hypothetical protein BBJ28_00004283 [Nothophytophthora sp. Chile5]
MPRHSRLIYQLHTSSRSTPASTDKMSTANTTPYDAVLGPVTEETRCRYVSKRCELPRSVKRNGELHRFCDYHRMKANLNQRRVDRKRKLKNEEDQSAVSPSKQDEPLQSDAAWHYDLDPRDLDYLDYLLSSGKADEILDGAESPVGRYSDFSAAAELFHQSF